MTSYYEYTFIFKLTYVNTADQIYDYGPLEWLNKHNRVIMLLIFITRITNLRVTLARQISKCI